MTKLRHNNANSVWGARPPRALSGAPPHRTVALGGEPNVSIVKHSALDREARSKAPEAGALPGGSNAFTLIELLVVMSIILILSSLSLSALSKSKASAHRAKCMSNLRELGIAAELYWNDNSDKCFTTATVSTNGGVIHWCGWIDGTKPEGQRTFDFSAGKLFPYLNSSDVRLCPSLNPLSPQFKLKVTNLIFFSYGYNGAALSPAKASDPAKKITDIKQVSGITLFADAAQINDFQSPASPLRPMVEEWYYLDNPTNTSSRNYYPHGHFRHSQKASVVFCDGHVGMERMIEGSIDTKIPSQFVGRYRPEILQEAN